VFVHFVDLGIDALPSTFPCIGGCFLIRRQGRNDAGRIIGGSRKQSLLDKQFRLLFVDQL
jgi:hypothetical protein